MRVKWGGDRYIYICLAKQAKHAQFGGKEGEKNGSSKWSQMAEDRKKKMEEETAAVELEPNAANDMFDDVFMFLGFCVSEKIC